MKQNRLRTIFAVALAIISLGVWAAPDSRIVIAEVENGTITASAVAATGEQTVTLTVTPDDLCYIKIDDIIVSKTSSTALARRATPNYADKLKVTAVKVDDYGAGTYQFTVPDGCGAYVEATFKKQGDANGDNLVNVADVDFVIEAIGEDYETHKTANVNGDDKIDIADVDYVIERIQ